MQTTHSPAEEMTNRLTKATVFLRFTTLFQSYFVCSYCLLKEEPIQFESHDHPQTDPHQKFLQEFKQILRFGLIQSAIFNQNIHNVYILPAHARIMITCIYNMHAADYDMSFASPSCRYVIKFGSEVFDNTSHTLII